MRSSEPRKAELKLLREMNEELSKVTKETNKILNDMDRKLTHKEQCELIRKLTDANIKADRILYKTRPEVFEELMNQ